MRWTWNSFLLALAFSVCFATFPANASETQTTPIDPTEDVERGRKAIRVGRYEHAVERLERAVTSAPDSVPAQLGLAWAYLKLRQFGPCVQQAVRVLEKAPENARAHAIVGSTTSTAPR